VLEAAADRREPAAPSAARRRASPARAGGRARAGEGARGGAGPPGRAGRAGRRARCREPGRARAARSRIGAVRAALHDHRHARAGRRSAHAAARAAPRPLPPGRCRRSSRRAHVASPARLLVGLGRSPRVRGRRAAAGRACRGVAPRVAAPSREQPTGRRAVAPDVAQTRARGLHPGCCQSPRAGRDRGSARARRTGGLQSLLTCSAEGLRVRARFPSVCRRQHWPKSRRVARLHPPRDRLRVGRG
jgi:hypothetical protein